MIPQLFKVGDRVRFDHEDENFLMEGVLGDIVGVYRYTDTPPGNWSYRIRYRASMQHRKLPQPDWSVYSDEIWVWQGYIRHFNGIKCFMALL